MANINIFALGGQDENGKNCYVIEVEKDIYVINSGIKVPIKSRYGIDGIIPDFEYLIKNKNRIKGIFITHAHDEAFAALPWMLMDLKGIDIYGSQFTIKAIEDRVSKYKIPHKEYKLKEIVKELKFENSSIVSFELASSIPGSLGFKINTQDGAIVFLSNFIVDDLKEYGKTDFSKIVRPNEKILTLLMDARKSNYHGYSSDFKSVLKIIEPKFKNGTNDQRIIVGGYDEEMYSMQEILSLAIKYNRPVALYGRAFNSLYQILKKLNPSIQLPKFVDYKEIKNYKNVVVLITGTWSRLYSRFVRIAEKADVYLTLKHTDKLVMIAPPINGLEVEYTQMLDKVLPSCPDITEITFSDYYSLRPASSDIQMMIERLKPKYFIPISALYRYLIVARNIGIEQNKMNENNCLILYNGKIVLLQNGQLVSKKGILKEYGEKIIDGFGIGDVSKEVIKEREALSANGFILIASKIDKKTKKLIKDGSSIKVIGVGSEEDIRELLILIEKNLEKKMEEIEKFNMKEAQNIVKKRVQKIVSKFLDKKPLVIVTFYEI